MCVTKDRVGWQKQTTAELSQCVSVEDVRVLECLPSSLCDWESLSLMTAKAFRRGASRLRGLVGGFMHGPAGLAGLSLDFDWIKSKDSNSQTENAVLTVTVGIRDLRKISCSSNDLCYRNAFV